MWSTGAFFLDWYRCSFLSRITSLGKMSVFVSITPALNLFHEESHYFKFKLSGSVSKERGRDH